MRETLAIPVVLPEFIARVNASFEIRGETARASSRVPKTRPAKFVRAMQLSANRLSVAHAEVFILCECWAPTETAAGNLGALAYAIASTIDLPSGAYCPEGASGTVSAPYASDDPDTGLPRTVFTVRLIVPVTAI